MQTIVQERLTGERALFHGREMEIQYCVFADGESPLKESRDIRLEKTSFQWKYPLWYCRNIEIRDCSFAQMARAGIWYTDDIHVCNTLYEAPKGFRRVNHLTLEQVDFPDAQETLWHCRDVTMKDVVAKGDYFAMNCEKMDIRDFRLSGNYSFDGCRDIEIHNAKMLSKDAFWNCDNVTVYDSYICGEYLGWNSRNLTFVNCVIESLQGMCYIQNLTMKNCRLVNTTLAFEYTTLDAEIDGFIDSVKNPSAGIIRAEGIGELILEQDKVDVEKTKFDLVKSIV
jgi:hypothetical protein